MPFKIPAIIDYVLGGSTSTCQAYPNYRKVAATAVQSHRLDLSGKEPHRQVVVDRMLVTGSIGSVTVSALAPGGQDVLVVILLLAQYLPSILLMALVAVTSIVYNTVVGPNMCK